MVDHGLQAKARKFEQTGAEVYTKPNEPIPRAFSCGPVLGAAVTGVDETVMTLSSDRISERTGGMSKLLEIDAFELCSTILTASGFDVAPLVQLANNREADWLEFKEAITPSNHWRVAKSALALANTHGGCLLIGVNDNGDPVGLDRSDPKAIRRSKGTDAFLRHVEETVLRPRSGWDSSHTGRIDFETPPPHDLLQLHIAALGDSEILAVLVRARAAGEKCIHCVEGPREKERVFVPVRKLGGFGRVTDLVRPAEIEGWQHQRKPKQLRYAELSTKCSLPPRTAVRPVIPADLEERIAIYHNGLRKLLEEIDRYFVALDAEERTDVNVADPSLQPWAEEYLAEDLGWESANVDERGPGIQAELDVTRMPRVGGVFDLLEEEPRAVLLGEPGGGKTTCLKRMALQAALKYSPGGTVAAFVPLSRYGGTGDLKRLVHRAVCFGEDAEKALSMADLELLLQTTRMLLLLDALNECPQRHREACVGEIVEFLEQYPGASVTITARTAGWGNQLQLPTFTVRPLDKVGQETLLASFLGDQLTAHKLHEELMTFPGGTTTASNPLILRMAIQIFREDGHLPLGRALLYRRFIGLWYSREVHKARKAGTPLPWDERIVRGGLARLAFTARTTGERVIPRVNAKRVLTDLIAEPAEFLDRLGQGFLLRCSGEDVDFAHETFQEYLAAEYCIAAPQALDDHAKLAYSDWGMVLAFAAELSEGELSSRLIATAWRLNPWLGAVLTPTGHALPPNWQSSLIGADGSAMECLRLFALGLPATDVRFTGGQGWYRRDDAALLYAISTDSTARDEWRAMEVGLLKGAWHPAIASNFLRRAISDVTSLLAAAWPIKRSGGTSREWRLPKSWVTKANPLVAHRLIEIGAMSADDFVHRKELLITSATPAHARHWIEAGVLAIEDFRPRREQWISDCGLEDASELIKAGICDIEDFAASTQELFAKATPIEAVTAVALGICRAEDFGDRRRKWAAEVSAKDARKLISGGICARDDFADRKERIITTSNISGACRWIGSGVCRPEDFAIRRTVWIRSASVKDACQLIRHGVCTPSDFEPRKQKWIEQSTPKNASRLVMFGICSAEEITVAKTDGSLLGDHWPSSEPPAVSPSLLDRRSEPGPLTWPNLITALTQCSRGQTSLLWKRRGELSATSALQTWAPDRSEYAKLKQAGAAVARLRATGGASYSDYEAFDKAFNSQELPWQELRNIAMAYLTESGVNTRWPIESEVSTADLPTPPFSRDILANNVTRLTLSRYLDGKTFEATVARCAEGFCFLEHPEFCDGVFYSTNQRQGDELPPTTGDRVRCEVVIRLDQKRHSWSFAAKSVALLQRRADSERGSDSVSGA